MANPVGPDVGRSLISSQQLRATVRIRCVGWVSSVQCVPRDSSLGDESRSQRLEVLHALTRTLTTRVKPVRLNEVTNPPLTFFVVSAVVQQEQNGTAPIHILAPRTNRVPQPSTSCSAFAVGRIYRVSALVNEQIDSEHAPSSYIDMDPLQVVRTDSGRLR